MTNEDKKYFKFYKTKKKHITLLQETHSNTNIVKKWEKEWEGTSHWHSG